jgi:colicin import membrane protein
MSGEKQETFESKEGLTAAEAAELAEAAAKIAAEKAAAAKAAAELAAKKEYEEAAKVVAAAKAAGAAFTDKRSQERIFRREMGEPEFFHHKKDLVPPKYVLSEEEQEEISRRAEIPSDQTPAYKPEHVLSPEFGGESNYESGVTELLQEAKQKLDRLKNDPYANPNEIQEAEKDLMYLDSLYQNYYFGMNVFRTAKHGRAKIKE